MATENIDVVIKSAGTTRVVRDLQEIGNAAASSEGMIRKLQQQILALGSGTSYTNFNRLLTQMQQLANLNFNPLISQLNAAQQALAQVNSTARSGAGSWNLFGSNALQTLRAVRSAVGGLVAALSVRQIAHWADAWIEAAGKIRVFVDSQEEANLIMDRLFTIAQNVRQPISSLATLYNRLSISGQELGVSQSKMLQFTELVGKALVVQGTSGIQARGVLLQLSQALGTVRIRAQEFNSMMENLPLVLKIVAQNVKGANGSVAQLRNMMKDGELTSKMFFEALMKGQDQLNKLYANAPKTFAQGWTVLLNAVEKYLGQLNAAYGISDKFYQLMRFIGDNLDNVGKLAVVAGAGIAAAFVPAAMTAFASALGVVVGLLVRSVLVLNAHPFAALVTAAVAAYQFGDALNAGVDNMTTLRDLVVATGSTALEVFGEMWKMVTGLFRDMSSFAQKAFGLISDGSVQSADTATGAYTDFYNNIGGTGLAWFLRAWAKTTDAVAGLITGFTLAAIRVMGGIPDAVDQIGARMRNFFIARVEDMINGTIQAVNKLRSITGGSMIGLVNLERAKVNEQYFKNWGASIASAIDEGFDIQGGYMQKKVEGLLQNAQKLARIRGESALKNKNGNGLDATPSPLAGADGKGKGNRKALNDAVSGAAGDLRESLDAYRAAAARMEELERHREAMLKASYDQGLINYKQYSTQLEEYQNEDYIRQKDLLEGEKSNLEGKLQTLTAALKARGATTKQIGNVTKDVRTEIERLDDALTKLSNKNEERLANSLAKALAPAVELVRNGEKEFELQQLNTQQEIQKAQAKANSAQLSERDQYIQEQTLKLTQKYEDELQKIYNVRQQMIKDGVFDDMSNPATKKAWNDINALQDKWQGALDKIKQDAPETFGAVFDAMQIDKFAKELNDKLTDAIINAGKDGGQGLRDWLKQALTQPLRVVIQALLQPITAGISSSLYSAVSGFTGGGGGGGNLSSLFSIGSSIFGSAGAYSALVPGLAATGAGSQAAMLAAQTGVFGLEGLGATAAAGGSALGGAIGAIGSALPYVGAALAVASLFGLGGKRGGPKTESGFGPGMPTRGDPSAARQYVQSIQQQYDALITAAGGTAGGLQVGAFSATDPQGTAMTQLAVLGQLNGREIYNRGSRLGGVENVGRGEDALKAAMAEEMNRVLLSALQAAGVGGALQNYLNSLGDLNKLSADEIQKTMDRVSKAINERASLEQRLFEASATDLEKLNKTRNDERKAIDETNQALLEQVYAQEDLNKAKQDLLDAYQREKSTMEETVRASRDFANTLRDFVTTQRSGSTSSLGLLGRTAEAQAAYKNTLGLAAGGDANARSNLTSRASAYLENVANSASTKLEYDRAFGQVMGDLTVLAASEDSKATMAEKQLDIMTRQLEALNLLNTTQISYADAWAAYTQAQLKVEEARQKVAAAAVASSPTPASTSGGAPVTYLDTDPNTGLPWGPGTRYPTKADYVSQHPIGMGGGQPPGYDDGGLHPGGWRMVGESGWEVENTAPSRIYNQDQMGQMMASAMSTQDLLLELEALRAVNLASAQALSEVKMILKELRDRGIQVYNSIADGALTTKAA